MTKKKTRNKFRDLLADYYLTNREITKHYDREHEKEKGSSQWKGSEKTMIIITVIALVLIISKYLMKIL